MRRETQRRVVSALARVHFLCTAILVCQLSAAAFAAPKTTIVCREELPVTRREVLAEKLSAITGLQIDFDLNGGLRVMPAASNGGSQTARELIMKAVSGRDVIVVEDASDRQDVVFSRVVPAAWKHHATDLPPVFVMLIDFADFDRLLGDEDALRAFDVGWSFLHELDHVVNDSEDAGTLNEAGDCEDHINIMRQECNLPLRTNYFFTFFPHAEDSDFRARFVRLAFDRIDPKTKKHHRYWVMWDAALVGGLPQIASAR